MQQEKHKFALYYDTLPFAHNTLSQIITITDLLLYQRIVNILRLHKDECVILFNQQQYMHVKIHAINKNTIEVIVEHSENNKIISPPIIFLLPVLKKEALEEAIYSLTELGAQKIQLIITKKIHQKINPEKEYQRLQKIIIAAAEQSKNFAFPTLEKPQPLTTIVQNYQTSPHLIKLFFDPIGVPLSTIISTFTKNKSYLLLVGPEGDMSFEEKLLIKQHDFVNVALTPTILRAQQAVAVSMGILRSYIN